FAQNVKPESVQAPFINDRNRVNDVAGAFADFRAILLPPAVDKDLFRQRQAHRLEHDRPVNRVKFHNVLADDMDVGGPQLNCGLRIADCGLQRTGDNRIAVGGGDADVIHQRVEPDVGDIIFVEGQGN